MRLTSRIRNFIALFENILSRLEEAALDTKENNDFI